ncbi:hypothetical protein U1Q18_025341, partial [Sarracenia purpurea var. burkii]
SRKRIENEKKHDEPDLAKNRLFQQIRTTPVCPPISASSHPDISNSTQNHAKDSAVSTPYFQNNPIPCFLAPSNPSYHSIFTASVSEPPPHNPPLTSATSPDSVASHLNPSPTDFSSPIQPPSSDSALNPLPPVSAMNKSVPPVSAINTLTSFHLNGSTRSSRGVGSDGGEQTAATRRAAKGERSEGGEQ